ncbi:hypothetical protein [Actinotalea sp. Marseille-Q4924]|uniref:hypothetical protein n=1 Tax=Actinotalea sp. Marseille-Q4924 TaxID=2866571 RepID=UPI001CE480A4|nr:hypothetical protein [Actinotalea sp. Marseille-Q4924]
MTAFISLTESEHGDVPVDSGHLLIVDPCHLPPDLVASLTRPNRHGVTAAALVATPSGDGLYPVIGERGALVVLDPHHDDTDPASWGDGRAYREVVLDEVL